MALLLVAGCTPTPDAPPGVTNIPVLSSSPVVSTQTQKLTPEQISQVIGPQSNTAYRLGPDDVIAVNVYDHPELTIPGPSFSPSIPGVLVTSDGTIQLPLIGSIDVGGETIEQAENTITNAYANDITAPQVSIQLIQPHSFRYYILGQFSEPGVKYPNHAMDLLSALALGGSVDLGTADLYQAYVAHDGVKLPVDLHRLLVEGDMSQNIRLASGDTIVVPSSASESAFVFGAVGKPGQVHFVGGKLTLLQALSDAGMGLSDISSARFKSIHIIRASGNSAQLIVVDATATLTGGASDFTLHPGDIVYVPPTQLASWNQALTLLLPSLQTVSDLLNPFVSIAYLSRKN
ncbi:MAG: polysaccharide biosynthesis/export family protein [Acidocella sp.]|nr:polysaccharide biosynthesis/export family protein [Acidocella sp.]